MALIDLIEENIVKVPLVSNNKQDVIRELIQILKKAGRISDFDKACSVIFAREAQGSTGLEHGVAVPHAKTDTVDTLTLAIGVSPLGIEFAAIDGNPSNLFFLMLAPPNQSGPHLEALSEIARLTRSTSFCNLLINASSAKEVVELFKED